MLKPLFVNFNPAFISRIRTESSDQALLTQSYTQALRWISDPTIFISAIYLNPNDPSYSALRFLEISLLQRPATPIFLIDEDNEFSSENSAYLFEKFNIRKIFKGQKTYEQLLKVLNLESPRELLEFRNRSTTSTALSGYIAVPIVDFIHSKYYPFNAFALDDSKNLNFFAMAGSEIDLEYLKFLSQKTPVLYVEEQAIQSRRSAFREIQDTYLDPTFLSPSWRSAETLYRAKMLLNELKSGKISEVIIKQTYQLVEEVVQHVSQLSSDSLIRKFIAQAERYDRTVTCTTYSVLICKQLKYSQSSIIENLGIASFLQDVALYNSPYGNLSEIHPSQLPEVEKKYYLNHPLSSAEMIAAIPNIPEVVIQIIKQHHERGDRSGFPNGIGGTQLQPLAEILSLVNAYVDHRSSGRPLEETFSHYNEDIVHAFKKVITSQRVVET